ncbi:MAG: hypothetical protein MI923_28835 [Phycisphaerales bacterium]|nr:hypothetical protein [Phycisphaerales bacterium]
MPSAPYGSPTNKYDEREKIVDRNLAVIAQVCAFKPIHSDAADPPPDRYVPFGSKPAQKCFVKSDLGRLRPFGKRSVSKACSLQGGFHPPLLAMCPRHLASGKPTLFRLQ